MEEERVEDCDHTAPGLTPCGYFKGTMPDGTTVVGYSKPEPPRRRIDGYIRCKRLSPMTKVPTKGSVDAAGFDLYSAQTATLLPGQRGCISTGISIEIPPGYYGRIAPRSGLAVNYGIDILAGIIDSDYRGEIKVVLINHGDRPFDVKQCDRIAQLIIGFCGFWAMEEVEELDGTDRGAGGFGSTGV